MLHILQVSTADGKGGAEKVAYNLHKSYRERGHKATLAVGYKLTADPDVLVVSNEKGGLWYRSWTAMGNVLTPLVGKVRGVGRLRCWSYLTARPKKLLARVLGHEDLEFPGTWQVLDLLPQKPDIVHCHNLHGGYFHLRALPWLSQQVPTILTLHDAWLLSGHCAHSFDCERWKTGCGRCPDLTIYPTIRRDATAYNWRKKREIYARCRLYIATPSRWLMQKVEQSILAPAIVEARVISNGVDLAVFRPGSKMHVRSLLGTPQQARVVLFTANGIRQNIWKDYRTMQSALAQVAERLREENIVFLALGEEAPAERIGRAEIRFVAYQKDPEMVARYYEAADVYVHAARADTFPNTVLEALACGTPVVATAVGGIPEQVKSLEHKGMDASRPTQGPDGATGVVVPPGDSKALAEAIVTLLTNEHLRFQLGKNAARDAHEQFNLQRQADDYLAWYGEIIEKEKSCLTLECG